MVQGFFILIVGETWGNTDFSTSTHRRSQGGPKRPCPPKIFRKYSHFVFYKQNWVNRLKSKILAPPKGLATPLHPRVWRFLSWLSSCALAQHSVTRTKNFSSRPRPAPSTTRSHPATSSTCARPRTYSSVGSRTRTTHAGTRNPRGVNPHRAEL